MSQGKGFYIPFQDGSGRIHGICWEPEEAPWAVIQVAHGMIEHIGRYDEFAQAMNRAGIAVVGHDHPGHGRTAKPGELGEFAEKQGVRRVIGAMAQVARFVKHKFPGIPHILLGHSMGSFFGRRFITRYGEWLDGAIFMGTGSQPELLLWLGGTVVAAAAWLEGRNGRNERLHQLVLGSYNHYFEKGKTKHQWLSRVTEEDEKYEADPYCQFLFADGAFVDFFQVMLDLKRKRGFEGIPKNLPILLISGKDDPVGEGGRGVRRAMEALRKTGCTNVEMKLYPGARHELFHERNREEVFGDIVAWLEKTENHRERC